MRSTALKMAKNQGLASISPDKKIKIKIKIKNFAIRQRSKVLGYRGGPPLQLGCNSCRVGAPLIRPYLWHTFRKPTKPPRGLLRGLLRGCCGAAATSLRGRGLLLRGCCYGDGRSETGGRAAPRERGTGANVPKSL